MNIIQKKQQLFFIRHGKLRLPYKDHSKMPFSVIADLANSKMSPSIDRDYIIKAIKRLSDTIPLDAIQYIYASPARRCQETARFVREFVKKKYGRAIRVKTEPLLREIKFDLRNLYQQDDKTRLDLQDINRAVLKAIADKNKNIESAERSYKRIHAFLKKIESISSLCISHDFFMRVCEIYIKNKGKPKQHFTVNELENTHRNLYLHGFATDLQFNLFSLL